MKGRVWKFGDGIDTDLLAPGVYMKGPVADLAKHCLELVNPEFALNVQPGDIVVAGSNFGIGSSREQAAQALVILGVSCVLAPSFGGIFYRNAFNLGLPALVCPHLEGIVDGDSLLIDPEKGIVTNETSGETTKCTPIPPHLMQIVQAGGLVPYLEQRFGKTA